MQLSATEARVLGALIEKEISTPEYYPLSLNALLAACNQKSSREPVLSLTEDEVRGALRSLEDTDLVRIDHGSRVQRYEHLARTYFHLRRDETAVLCLLLLRGPQTPGELRGRADRLHSFDDLDAVGSALQRLSVPGDQRPDALVVQLPRQAGTKESRFAHTLGPVPAVQLPAVPQASEPAGAASLAARVSRLEEQLAELSETLQRLLAKTSESEK